MQVKDYIDLKSKSSVSLSKDIEDGKPYYYLIEKRFDPTNGSALSDDKQEVSLEAYKSELVRITSEIAEAEATKAGYTKIIEDIEAL